MTNIVVTLVHFLCGLRWELPSVLGTAQSRGSPSRALELGRNVRRVLWVVGDVGLGWLTLHTLRRRAMLALTSGSDGGALLTPQ